MSCGKLEVIQVLFPADAIENSKSIPHSLTFSHGASLNKVYSCMAQTLCEAYLILNFFS